MLCGIKLNPRILLNLVQGLFLNFIFNGYFYYFNELKRICVDRHQKKKQKNISIIMTCSVFFFPPAPSIFCSWFTSNLIRGGIFVVLYLGQGWLFGCTFFRIFRLFKAGFQVGPVVCSSVWVMHLFYGCFTCNCKWTFAVLSVFCCGHRAVVFLFWAQL